MEQYLSHQEPLWNTYGRIIKTAVRARDSVPGGASQTV